MSEDPPSVTTARLIDRICDRFERAWRCEAKPQLESYLAEAPDDCRPDLFQELLALEVQIRRTRRETPSQEEYERRYRRYAEHVPAAFDLADEAGAEPGIADPVSPDALLVYCPACGFVDAGPHRQSACENHDRFGRFELFESLGLGGFGTVWKARDTVLKRWVALKIPKNGQFCREEATTLLAKARAAARLKHPAIVQIYDAGIERGTAYIASEYVAGRSLRDELAGGPLSCRRAASIALRVADALDHAHEMGLVHRDLKPGNVLLDHCGNPYVADFGLAKVEDLHAAVTGVMVGTVGYRPPEQASGHGQVDRRADIYSLGVVLFEMVTGRRPFEGSLESVRSEIERTEPPRPRRWNGAVSRDLECICLKCLEKDPARRYPTAAALADDLRAFLRGDPLAARPLPAPVRLWRWCRRRPLAAALSMTSVVLFATVVAGSIAHSVHSARLADLADAELYGHQIARAHQSWTVNNIRQLEDILEGCPPQHRGWEWGYLKGLPDPAGQILPDAGGCVACSPDGTRIATGGGPSRAVRLWECATGKPQGNLLGHTNFVSAVAFHPDGELLASAGGDDRTIILWEVNKRLKQQTLRGHTARVASIAFSPDGRRLGAAGFDGTVRLWDIATGEEQLKLKCADRRVWSLSISPDGARIATTCGRLKSGAVQVWDAQTGREIATLSRPDTRTRVAFSPDGAKLAVAPYGGGVSFWNTSTWHPSMVIATDVGSQTCLAFSPDGAELASKQWNGIIRIWRTSDGREVLAIRGQTGNVEDLAFTPDGSRLVFGTSDNCVHVWDRAHEPGRVMLRAESDVSDVAFSPDSQRLVAALADGSVRLWDAAANWQSILLGRHTGEVRSVAFSPDGRRVISGSSDTTVVVWDAATGDALRTLRGKHGPVWSVACSPDDRWIASGASAGLLEVFDSRTGDLRYSFETYSRLIRSIAFHPSEDCITALSRDGRLLTWRLDTGRLTSTIALGWAACGMALSSDGHSLAAVTADGAVSLLDLDSEQRLYRSLPTAKVARSDVAYSPDGTRFVTATQGEAVLLWDSARRRPLLTLDQGLHVAGVVAFSPDQTQIATVSSGGIIRIFQSVRRKQGAVGENGAAAMRPLSPK